MVPRWSRLSNIEKFDAYTRWSLYLMAAVAPLLLMTWANQQYDDRDALRIAFWVAVLALTASSIVAIWQAAGRARQIKRLDKWALSAVLLSTAACVVLALLTWPPATERARGQTWVVMICVAYALAATTILLSLRTTVLMALAAAAGIAALWSQVNSREVVPSLFSTLALFASAVGAVRVSVAMLQLMYRIDQARAIESQLAVAEERLRFARDLHDTLGHNLSAIALKSQVARAQIERDPAAAGAEVDAVRTLADQSLTEMRAVVRGYRDADLDTEIAGARSLLASAGVACTVRGSAGGADELAWVVREGVTNVIRHSNATRCTIDVSSDAGVASVRIWNDGALPHSDRGTGIIGLRDRLAAVGGTLSAARPRTGEFELVATKGVTP